MPEGACVYFKFILTLSAYNQWHTFYHREPSQTNVFIAVEKKT